MPDPNYSGMDSFSFLASDGMTNIERTISINVGEYTSELSGGVYDWNSHKIISGQTYSNDSSVIDIDDALAALQIAAKSNPNPNDKPVSPYQYLAADVDKNGSVNAFDSLSILKMIAGVNEAPKAELLLVDEYFDFWASPNESQTISFETDQIDWAEIDASLFNNTTTSNYVAFLKGDVDGSWGMSLPDGPSLSNSYFNLLESNHGVPVDQFWIA